MVDLRGALGIPQWDVLGVSYGTKWAQTVAARDPDGVRRVVAHLPYPFEADLFEEDMVNRLDGVSAIFDGCARDAACHSAYPNLKAQYIDALRAANQTPLPVGYQDGLGNTVNTLDGTGLFLAIQEMQYSGDDFVRVPAIVDAAASRNIDRLSALLSSPTPWAVPDGFDDDLSWAMGQNLSIECQEKLASVWPGERLFPLASAWPDDIIALARDARAEYRLACRIWGVRALGPQAAVAPPVAQPTLVIYGQYDPASIARWANQMAAPLPASQVLMLPNDAHGPMNPAMRPCFDQIVASFLRHPAAVTDATCAADPAPPGWVLPGQPIGHIHPQRARLAG